LIQAKIARRAAARSGVPAAIVGGYAARITRPGRVRKTSTPVNESSAWSVVRRRPVGMGCKGVKVIKALKAITHRN
jgi:hypothetical protein